MLSDSSIIRWCFFKCAESQQLGLDLMVAWLSYDDHWYKHWQADDVVVGTEHVDSSGLVRT
jgi:hypothetical protein